MADEERVNRKKRSGWGRVILVLLLLVVAGAVVSSVTVQVEGYARGQGHVTARQDPLLRASQKGPIAEIAGRQDQQVSTGQVVIRLDDSLAKVTLERARTAAVEGVGKIEVFEAECSLAKAKRVFEQEKAGLEIESAKRRVDQLIQGRAKGTVSPVELAEAELAYELVALRPDKVYEAEEELEKQQLVLLKQQQDAALAEVRLLEEQVASLVVRSPIAGRLVLNPLVVGEVVDANKVLGRVFDESSFTIEAKFPERMLYRLAEGQEAQVWPAGRSSWDEPLKGRVVKVSRLVQPQESGDGYFWVTLEVEQAGLALYPGQDAQVSVGVGKVSLLRSILGL